MRCGIVVAPIARLAQRANKLHFKVESAGRVPVASTDIPTSPRAQKSRNLASTQSAQLLSSQHVLPPQQACAVSLQVGLLRSAAWPSHCKSTELQEQSRT